MLIENRITSLGNMISTGIVKLYLPVDIEIVMEELAFIESKLPIKANNETEFVLSSLRHKLQGEIDFPLKDYQPLYVSEEELSRNVRNVCMYILNTIKEVTNGQRNFLGEYKEVLEDISSRDIKDVTYFDINHLRMCNDIMYYEPVSLDYIELSYRIHSLIYSNECKLIGMDNYYNSKSTGSLNELLAELQDICKQEEKNE